ncbi:MAG: hypothetical protein IPN06_14720 [Burkholderiales bacterium]|nr:hypothetical protein [Burkholderiales bacterium]
MKLNSLIAASAIALASFGASAELAVASDSFPTMPASPALWQLVLLPTFGLSTLLLSMQMHASPTFTRSSAITSPALNAGYDGNISHLQPHLYNHPVH